MIKRMIATSLAFFFIITSSHSQKFEWAKRIGGPGYDQDIRIAKNVHGNVHFIGSFEGTIDFDPGAGISNLTSVGLLDVFILKLDSIGNFLWAKRIGGLGNDSGVNIAVDSLGNIYTFGHFTGTADFDPGAGTSNVTSIGGTDIFVSKLDPDGTLLWVKSFGGSNYDLSSSIAIDDLGNIYMTGTFTETVDFDPGGGVSTLTSEGANDRFILKLGTLSLNILAYNYGNAISVYPNPTKGLLNIDLSTFYNEVNVSVINQIGQNIQSKTFRSISSFQTYIPGESGIYFIEINTGDKKAILRVVKE